MRQALGTTTVNILQGKLFKDFGPPAIIVSDNGPQFKAKVFRKMCSQNGIEHVMITEYCLQGNLAEQYLRNLKSVLIACHARDHSTWDQNLGWIQLAFNTAAHEGHK